MPDRYPSITFFDWGTKRAKRVVKTVDLSCRSVHSLSFSADGKHVVVMGSGPEWNLVLLNWEKGKVAARFSNVGMVRWLPHGLVVANAS